MKIETIIVSGGGGFKLLPRNMQQLCFLWIRTRAFIEAGRLSKASKSLINFVSGELMSSCDLTGLVAMYQYTWPQVTSNIVYCMKDLN